MRNSAIIFSILCACVAAKAQGQDSYNVLVREAFSLYEKKEYRASADRYSEAFKALGWQGQSDDRYNAACSWSLAGVSDSAFFQLFRIAEKMGYRDLGHITTDSDLDALHTDARWGSLIAIVRTNKERAEVNLDHALVAQLDSIGILDQRYRQQIDDTRERFGNDSNEMRALWKTMAATDSVNLIAISRILDERGWLGADIVGDEGSATLFLVIQHSDLPVQVKYLPMMRDAVAKGNARAADLALLEDRVALRLGRKQIYGSQLGMDPTSGMYYFSPLEDPEHVDERRATVGLQPLADYAAYFGLTWDVDAYKKDLPRIEEMVKKQGQ